MPHTSLLSLLTLSTLALAPACVALDDDDAPLTDDELGEVTGALAATSRSVQNPFTGKCLDIPGGSRASGAAVNQFTCHGGPAQQFIVEGVPGVPGFVRIRNLNSNMCVVPTGYRGWSTTSMWLAQGACTSGSSWTQENWVMLFGGYRTTFRWTYDSTFCIDVPSGSHGDGQRLQAYPCHGGPNQVFDVRP